MRILVIDDEPMIRASIRRALSLKGHEVVDLGSAQQALDEMDGEAAFDAIVTDLCMPDLDGRTFAAEVEERFGPQRLLLITGWHHPDATSFHRTIPVLHKPFTPLELLDAVEAIPLAERAPTGRPLRIESVA